MYYKVNKYPMYSHKRCVYLTHNEFSPVNPIGSSGIRELVKKHNTCQVQKVDETLYVT